MTYGAAYPAFTGTLTWFLVASRSLPAALPISGETVAGSPYTISATLAPAGVLGNYTITYNTADFTIDKKAASETPKVANNTYGRAHPALNGTLTGLLVEDDVTET